MNVNEKEAKEIIIEKDKAKANLVKTYFHKDICDPLHYDVIWNTERVRTAEIAEILVDMIRQKARMG